MTDTQHTPRAAARAIMRDSLPAEQWARNEAFTERLKATITGHRLYTHPILAAWERNEFTLESLRFVHLEVRAGFLELFMDRCSAMQTRPAHATGGPSEVAAGSSSAQRLDDSASFPRIGGGGLPRFPTRRLLQLMDALVALVAPPETWWDADEPRAQRASHLPEQDDICGSGGVARDDRRCHPFSTVARNTVTFRRRRRAERYQPSTSKMRRTFVDDYHSDTVVSRAPALTDSGATSRDSERRALVPGGTDGCSCGTTASSGKRVSLACAQCSRG